ncbi:Peptidase, M20A family [Kitasatospora purpeofusca]
MSITTLPAPRACGVGPRAVPSAVAHQDCSPRMRGWSLLAGPGGVAHLLLPAHAGLVPSSGWRARARSAAPRACGVGPRTCLPYRSGQCCSPRMRGWSRGRARSDPQPGLLPAHAGLVPARPSAKSGSAPAPRACGVGPGNPCDVGGIGYCSPRMRGWSPQHVQRPDRRELLPAHAGLVPRRPGVYHLPLPAPRACGVGPGRCPAAALVRLCSPRMRGWSHQRRLPITPVSLLPAHAGLVPRRPGVYHLPLPAPRACGVGPLGGTKGEVLSRCSPRMRGWSRHKPPRGARSCPAPRACGVGPAIGVRTQRPIRCSPRMRGWSRSGSTGARVLSLLPAHAGLVPPARHRRCSSRAAPRACGVGPMSEMCDAAEVDLLPAHAGLVPCGSRGSGGGLPAPRACGVGPPELVSAITPVVCSPRMRGWSRGRARRTRPPALLPAHAGLVPSRRAGATAPGAAPRACGVGPPEDAAPRQRTTCSPRMRGWSRHRDRLANQCGLLPAHAGLVPSASPRR